MSREMQLRDEKRRALEEARDRRRAELQAFKEAKRMQQTEAYKRRVEEMQIKSSKIVAFHQAVWKCLRDTLTIIWRAFRFCVRCCRRGRRDRRSLTVFLSI